MAALGMVYCGGWFVVGWAPRWSKDDNGLTYRTWLGVRRMIPLSGIIDVGSIRVFGVVGMAILLDSGRVLAVGGHPGEDV